MQIVLPETLWIFHKVTEYERAYEIFYQVQQIGEKEGGWEKDLRIIE